MKIKTNYKLFDKNYENLKAHRSWDVSIWRNSGWTVGKRNFTNFTAAHCLEASRRKLIAKIPSLPLEKYQKHAPTIYCISPILQFGASVPSTQFMLSWTGCVSVVPDPTQQKFHNFLNLLNNKTQYVNDS